MLSHTPAQCGSDGLRACHFRCIQHVRVRIIWCPPHKHRAVISGRSRFRGCTLALAMADLFLHQANVFGRPSRRDCVPYSLGRATTFFGCTPPFSGRKNVPVFRAQKRDRFSAPLQRKFWLQHSGCSPKDCVVFLAHVLGNLLRQLRAH